MVHEENLLALVKVSEKYIFFYDDEPESIECLFKIFDRYALDDGLNFSKFDASFFSKKVKELQNDRLIIKNRLENMFKKYN